MLWTKQTNKHLKKAGSKTVGFLICRIHICPIHGVESNSGILVRYRKNIVGDPWGPDVDLVQLEFNQMTNMEDLLISEASLWRISVAHELSVII